MVLNACYTAAQADALLAHVDCVVGMAGSVHDGAVWDLEAGRALATLRGHTNWSERAVTPDDRRVISGSDDRTLKAWDLETGRELAT